MTTNGVLEVGLTKMTFIVSESKMAAAVHFEFMKYQIYAILYINPNMFYIISGYNVANKSIYDVIYYLR